jgi:NADH:ubiquinone oxidoreductase subunit 2 (subunit N)
MVGIYIYDQKFKSKYILNKNLGFIEIFGIQIVGCALIAQILLHPEQISKLVANYLILINSFTDFVKICILCFSYVCMSISVGASKYEGIREYEDTFLFLISIVGILTAVSCNDLMALFLSLEMQALCFYCLVSLKMDSENARRVAISYIVAGSSFSLAYLFGCSIIYKETGGSNFCDI